MQRPRLTSSGWTERLTARLDEWIFHSNYVTARGQAAFRILLAIYLLLFFTPGHHDYALAPLADLPSSLFSPPLGPMMLTNGLPSATVIELVSFALTLSLVCVLLGWFTRPFTAIAAVSILLLEGFGNSLGKVNHGGLLTGYLMLVMVFSSWGKTYSIDSVFARRRGEAAPAADENSWVGPMVALIAGLMFLSAGVAKAQAGWLGLDTHATEHIADTSLFRGDGGPLGEFMLNAGLGGLWETGDYATIAFEAGMILAVVKLAWLRGFFVFAIGFHIINYLVLNIPFATIIGVYGLFLPWELLFESQPLQRLSAGVESVAANVRHPLAPAAIALPVALALHAFGSPILQPLEWALPGEEGVQQAVVYSLCIAVVAVCLWAWLRGSVSRGQGAIPVVTPMTGDTRGA